MKLPIKWLNDYTEMTGSIHDFCHKMTMSGSKVESFESESDCIKNVVCARVLSLERHPNSDHLWICQMDTGADKPVQICTGAQNLKVGDLVPAALDNSDLPGNIHIASTVMRGVPSNGMLCSIGELGLTLHECPYAIEDGILVLSPELNAKPGDDICKVLGLDDTVVDFEITPNRPDCLSVIGLARESAVTFGKELKLPAPSVKSADGDINEHLSVSIKTPLCPRYTAAMVKDIKIAPSPVWMRERLHSAGIRPINNIVDITNFVMLEYGQPMHAFDYACIDGKNITVRVSEKGESTETLDGQKRELAENTILITDKSKIIGVAGVMGGLNSEITEKTEMIVFESANFNAPAVRIGSRKIGMRTEASSRFEKGLDCENTMPALMRALQLVEELGAGKIIGGIIDCYPEKKAQRTIKLEPERICRFIGADIPRDFMEKTLLSLGFELSGDTVTVPSWRDDVEGFADIAEEVARFYGFDKIKPTLFAGRTTQGGLSTRQLFERELALSCRAVGYSECCTLSFISPKVFDKINLPEDSTLRKTVTILNPLGEDQSLLRTTPIPSMMDVVARNFNFRAPSVKLFEPATVYLPTLENGKVDASKLADERKILTLASYGAGDFFALKGDVCELLSASGVSDSETVPCTDNPCYHPGRCASIVKNGVTLGVFGQLHPSVSSKYGIDAEVYFTEIDVALMLDASCSQKLYTPLPKYPAVTRDLALVCDEGVYALSVEKCIKAAAGENLAELALFDIYRGAQLGENKKSLAYTLTMRHLDRTLTDKEADETVSKVLDALKSELNITLRA